MSAFQHENKHKDQKVILLCNICHQNNKFLHISPDKIQKTFNDSDKFSEIDIEKVLKKRNSQKVVKR